MILDSSNALDFIANIVTEALISIWNLIKFCMDLPLTLITLFNSFPLFFRLGFSVIFTMIILALVVRIKSYLI